MKQSVHYNHSKIDDLLCRQYCFVVTNTFNCLSMVFQGWLISHLWQKTHVLGMHPSCGLDFLTVKVQCMLFPQNKYVNMVKGNRIYLITRNVFKKDKHLRNLGCS